MILTDPCSFVIKQSDFTYKAYGSWSSGCPTKGRQKVTCDSLCFSATYSYLIEFSSVRKCGSRMTLPVNLDIVIPRTCASKHKASCSVPCGLFDKWCAMSCYQWAKPLLRTCTRSSWNFCNRHWSTRSQPCLISRLLFIHNNARPHVPQMPRHTRRRLGWETMCHPRYSLGRVPTGYHLFNYLEISWEILHKWGKLAVGITDCFASKNHPDIAQLEANSQNFLYAEGVTLRTNAMSTFLYAFFF